MSEPSDVSGRWTMLGRKLAVAIGIAIVFPMMVHYGVRTLTPAPEWDEYFEETVLERPVPEAIERSPAQIDAERRRIHEAQQKYETAQRDFARILFWAALPAGLAAILIGGFIGVPGLSAGLIVGGVATLTHGYTAYWDHLDDAFRFASLVLAFIALVAVAWKKLRPAG